MSNIAALSTRRWAGRRARPVAARSSLRLDLFYNPCQVSSSRGVEQRGQVGRRDRGGEGAGEDGWGHGGVNSDIGVLV
jgi:hypothetical protein